jgi:hypothetical protein
MRILFDHNTPRQLRRRLVGHDVDVAGERGWATLVNGELLDRAEDAGYEVMVTADQGIPYEQDMGRRNLALVVLGANRWPLIEPRIGDIRAALEGIRPGEVRVVAIPMRGEA